MTDKETFKAAVLGLKKNSKDFDRLALELFQFQAVHNHVYKEYIAHLGVQPKKVNRVEKIPFLPISFFKFHQIKTQNDPTSIVFRSSGTTGQLSSEHHISDLLFYEFLSTKIFENLYGQLANFDIFALLPNYLERDDSSLVYMIKGFMMKTYSKRSGFYLDDIPKMLRELRQALHADKDRKVLLIGVTFALLDLAVENEKLAFLHEFKDRIILMETGGMKGRRKEMLREEVHKVLSDSFGVDAVHSEYGMTELQSQAYALKGGLFEAPPSMKVFLREMNDPFSLLPSFKIGKSNVVQRERGKTGGINVIDLANIDSCCFIETQDLGSYHEDYKYFKVLGRFDNSELRGCNLMVNY